MLIKQLNHSVKKTIFKKLSVKLSKECVFSVNSHLIKQIYGCPMVVPVSVVISDIFMCKMEEDVVVSHFLQMLCL